MFQIKNFDLPRETRICMTRISETDDQHAVLATSRDSGGRETA
jgi:hypothetical protein